MDQHLFMMWKLLDWGSHFLYWAVFAWIVFGLVVIKIVGNRRPARVLDNGQIEFAPHWFTIWAWFLFIGCMARSVPILSKQCLNSPVMQQWNIPWNFVFLMFVGLSTVMIFSDLPASIIVSEEGLEQLYWLRRRKRIRWNDIVKIENSQKDRSITIKGADGTKIVHTGFLADRMGLLLELKQYCCEKLPLDLSRESLND